MELTIKKLDSSLTDDFLYFFENVAFCDHEEWAFCYCLECHLGEYHFDLITDRSERQSCAIDLIKKGVMQGYLAYEGEKVVGWCSATDKANCSMFLEDPVFSTPDTEKGLIKSVYCFDIAPDKRKQGIASLMLERVCLDSAAEGFSYVEAYPFADEGYEYQYHGSRAMFEKQGFYLYKKGDDLNIMRKKL